MSAVVCAIAALRPGHIVVMLRTGVWGLSTVLVMGLALACGLTEDDDPRLAGDGGGPAAGGSGGKGSNAAGAAPISQAEWEARTAIRFDHEAEATGCGGPVDASYGLEPPVSCLDANAVASDGTPIARCDVEPYCVRHADCTAGDRGRCRGEVSGSCEYDVGKRCTSDAECTDLPNGLCVTSDPYAGVTTCDPTGACEFHPKDVRSCKYPVEACAQDSDCTSLVRGTCVKRLSWTKCYYDDCATDSDCGADAMCGCSRWSANLTCATAGCDTDQDCGTGQRCSTDISCCGELKGRFCTTERDTCEEAPGSCTYQDGVWQVDPTDCGRCGE